MKEHNEDPEQYVNAYIAPSKESKSIRQELLSEDARNLLAYAFACRVPANADIPVRMTAVEVKIGDNDVQNIIQGGEGKFRKHGGCDSLCYFKEADDESWAVVFAHDCDGDPELGEEVFLKNKKPEYKIDHD